MFNVFQATILLLMTALVALQTDAELVHVVTPESIRGDTLDSDDVITVSPEGDSYLKALRESQSMTGIKRIDEEIIYGKRAPGVRVHAWYETSHTNHKHLQPRPQPPKMYGPPSPVPFVSHVSQVPHVPHVPHKPHFPQLTPFFGIPFSSSSGGIMASIMANIMAPFKKGIDLPTAMKIVLKLVLFKMVVKFFAVLCLLLFIPSLTPKNSNMDSDSRRIDQLNMLTDMVWESLGMGSSTSDVTEEQVISAMEDKSSMMPSAASALDFLQFCVSAVNTIVGSMLGWLRMRRNAMDVLDSYLWEKLKSLKTMIAGHK